MLGVTTIETGPFQANCHVLWDEERKECIVVDPGDDGPDLVEFLRSRGDTVVEIWNTHGHIDHINANAALKAAFPAAPIRIHALEQAWLGSALLCGASHFGLPFHPSKADFTWADGDTLEALGRRWRVHHTPGHSPGLCCLVCEEEKLLIAGDLLFQDSIGRTDLPGGSWDAMEASLRALFTGWGRDDWEVLPGHGPNTTVGRERSRNPFVREVLRRGPSV